MLQNSTKLGDPIVNSRYVNYFCLAKVRYYCVVSLSTLLDAGKPNHFLANFSAVAAYRLSE